MEINKEDQEWILESSKDLSTVQMAKILEIDEQLIKDFLNLRDTRKVLNRVKRVSNLKVNKWFIKSQIKAGLTQSQVAEKLNTSLRIFQKYLEKKRINWTELKNEIEKDKVNAVSKRCSKCHTIKLFKEFYDWSRKADPRKLVYKTSWCKSCYKFHNTKKAKLSYMF